MHASAQGSARQSVPGRAPPAAAGVLPWLAAVSAVWLLGSGCTEEVRLGRVLAAAGDPGAPGAGSGGSGGAGAGGLELPIGGGTSDAGERPPPFDAGPCVRVECGGRALECGDCDDDDGDGLIDASDPECLGPCDDSELGLYNGTSSMLTGSCRTDCYFDRNAGAGDDGCSWSYACDPRSTAPTFYPTGSSACVYQDGDPSCDSSPAALTACEAGCAPLTPNGCDCFGCCELPAGSDNFVWLGSESAAGRCEEAAALDRDVCRPCTPVEGCLNACELCELCVGKPRLPAECTGAPACRPGVRSCDPSTGSGCGGSEYCITGCCVPLPR